MDYDQFQQLIIHLVMQYNLYKNKNGLLIIFFQSFLKKHKMSTTFIGIDNDWNGICISNNSRLKLTCYSNKEFNDMLFTVAFIAFILYLIMYRINH